MTLDQGKNAREREWQFEAADLEAVHRWLSGQPFLPAVEIVDKQVHDLSDRYFDTSARAVHAAGYALRIREVDGKAEATMKSLAGGDGALKIREEISEDLPRPDPVLLTTSGGDVAARVREICGEGAVSPFLQIRTRRRKILAKTGESVLAEIALDHTTFPEAADPESSAILRVEVEIRAGREEELAVLVEKLRKECSLRPTTASKLEAGLRATGA